MKKAKRSEPRLVFWKEDIHGLQLLLRRLTDSSQLDGCVLYHTRHVIAEAGTIPVLRRDQLRSGKLRGVDAGQGARLAGFRASRLVRVEADALRQVRSFLDEIAGREFVTERISEEYGPSSRPPRSRA